MHPQSSREEADMSTLPKPLIYHIQACDLIWSASSYHQSIYHCLQRNVATNIDTGSGVKVLAQDFDGGS